MIVQAPKQMPELPVRNTGVRGGVQPAYLSLAEHTRKLEDAARHLSMRRRVPIAALDIYANAPATLRFRIPSQPHTDTLLLGVWHERSQPGQRLSLTTSGVQSLWYGGSDGWVWQEIPVTPSDTPSTWDITIVFAKEGVDLGTARLVTGILAAFPVQSVTLP
jgi:hypothetical protein